MVQLEVNLEAFFNKNTSWQIAKSKDDKDLLISKLTQILKVLVVFMAYVCDTSCHGVLFENSQHKVKHVHSSTLKKLCQQNNNNNNNTTTTIPPQ